jgi:hypothetical protein
MPHQVQLLCMAISHSKVAAGGVFMERAARTGRLEVLPSCTRSSVQTVCTSGTSVPFCVVGQLYGAAAESVLVFMYLA